MGILIDPAEVRAVLSREASADFVHADEVARMLAGEKVTELSVRHAEEMIALAEKGG